MYPQILEVVFKSHYSNLVFFALRYVSDREDAEDIVQEAFSKFLQKRESLLNEDENVIKSFLYQTVRNESLNYLKHQKIVHNHVSQSESEEIQEPVLTHIIHSEIIAQIRAAIGELPVGCREVALELFIEGKKYHEVAEELAISVHTVKARRKRALAFLKPRLEELAWVMLLNCYTGITE